METLEFFRKRCLRQQTELRRIMVSGSQHDEAILLFLSQHAMLHTQKMSRSETWSFEDEVLDDMTGEQMRQMPQDGAHSIAWLTWHMARCEDITMNLLVAGTPQVLHQDGWLQLTRSPIRDTGNAMDEAAMHQFNQVIDTDALRAYRLAVGCRTQEIVRPLTEAALREKVAPSRMQKVMEEGAVVEAAKDIADYWSRRTIAGLLLMPATRHNLVHMNEALQVKRAIQ